MSILALGGGAWAFTAKDGNFFFNVDVIEDICPENVIILDNLKPSSEDFVCTTLTIINKLDKCHFLNGETANCDPSIHKTIE